ncbi:MAG: hypothetical protein VYA99_10170 [Pseudomonadota bacterium]|nr:hypothetical protein [Pseudomonadota bacterium]
MNYKVNPIVNQITQLISGKGVPCDLGCLETEIDLRITRAKELFPGKSYCVVSQWTWADIDVQSKDAAKFRKSDIKPHFIYADNVVDDEARRWRKGSSVTTTLMVSFNENCIFCTRNTSYILMGTGTRMSVLPDVYIQLMA